VLTSLIAGLAQSVSAADEAEFQQLLTHALGEPGPWLIAAKIDNEPGRGTTDRNPARIRSDFMRGLGVRD
jgi:hypothetical protein